MQGEPFTPAEWSRIESRKGVLREGTRASAWVCADGRVMVDWACPAKPGNSQRYDAHIEFMRVSCPDENRYMQESSV